MRRYHFNIHEGAALSCDTDGTELPDLEAARLEAIRLAGALLKDAAQKFWVQKDWRLEVADDTGLILFVLNVSAFDAAAVAGRLDTA